MILNNLINKKQIVILNSLLTTTSILMIIEVLHKTEKNIYIKVYTTPSHENTFGLKYLKKTALAKGKL